MKISLKNDNHRSINGNDFSIDYYCDDELTSNMVLSLYGESALYPIINLAIKYNWQIFDTGIGEMIDLSDPAKNGYKNFQSYLTQILSKENLITLMLLQNIFIHHVHFWLKNKADHQKLIEGLNSLAAISHIKQIHIGIPADTHRGVVDRSYDAFPAANYI